MRMKQAYFKYFRFGSAVKAKPDRDIMSEWWLLVPHMFYVTKF